VRLEAAIRRRAALADDHILLKMIHIQIDARLGGRVDASSSAAGHPETGGKDLDREMIKWYSETNSIFGLHLFFLLIYIWLKT
jgi:hypothetical protein